MKKTFSWLKEYKKMSGEKRIKIALDLSDLVRKVYKEGLLARKNRKQNIPWKLVPYWARNEKN